MPKRRGNSQNPGLIKQKHDTLMVGGQESALSDFAEDLGRLLGTAQSKARNWLDQRKAISQQLTRVRQTADSLLRQLAGGTADMDVAVGGARGTRRGRPPGSKNVKKRRGRRTFTAAQRREQAERMRAYWAKRKAAAGRGRRRKSTDSGGVGVGNG
jgi:hypothetical protein